MSDKGSFDFKLFTNFLNFSSPYNTAISSITIILIIAIVFFLFKLFINGKKQYYSKDYWESRYKMFPNYMDWYCNFEKLSKDFKIDEILDTLFPNKKKTKIIELGCGNSCLSVDLSKYGYRTITSVDFSSTVIKQMREKYMDLGIEFLIGDFTKLNEMFKENSFDLVIEKAGLDSIATKETPDVPYTLRSIFTQIYTVLRPGGTVLSFSIKNPTFWHDNVYQHLVKSKMFQVVQQVCTVFTTEKNPTLMNLYFYQLKSLKK